MSAFQSPGQPIEYVFIDCLPNKKTALVRDGWVYQKEDVLAIKQY